MNEPQSPNETNFAYGLRTSGELAGKIALALTVITIVMMIGKNLIDLENGVISETVKYCRAHPEVEMWESEHGTANCSAWRNGTVVAT